MNISVIGSGSAGNCYRVSDGQTSLLLEAGLPIKRIKAACDYDLSGISACLVTHEHSDHIKAANDLMKAGVDVYMTEGTADAGKILTYRLKLWSRHGKEYCTERIGTFIVKPFLVHHDAAEPVGYLIESGVTGEKLLFCTDTYYIDYKFSGLTHIMCEANYSAETLDESDPRRSRLLRSHMSLENCIGLLAANDLSKIKEIWLIHLSSSNGDAEEFKRKIQETTGSVVHIA